ncbi:MAG: glycosyltransferase [Roseburia sp.]|nr:glycosyltransferase [Roseburia sp.]
MHQWLLKHGHDSKVFITRINDGLSTTEEGIYFFSSETDKKLHALFSRITGLQGYYSRISTWRLIRKLKVFNPEIVILRILHSNCINLSMLLQYLSSGQIATIVILHDCWYFTGHCCYYSQITCNRWKSICNKCPQIHEWNSSWFFDMSKRCLRDKQKWFSDIRKLGVIGVSDWITNEAKQSILKSAVMIRRIYNWIDKDIFRPQETDDLRAELDIQEKDQVLLGVAVGWSNCKGLREILLTAKELPAVKVILVGEISESMRYPANVQCVGRINTPGILAKYYSMADVFLNPSVQETFGKTTAEAICCGTPVVAYETTACTELIDGGRNGLLVKAGDKERYVDAVKKCLRTGKKEYMDRCREFVDRNFDLEKNMNQYMNVFTELSKL